MTDPICNRRNPGYPDGISTEDPFRTRLHPHLCRCIHKPGHNGKHYCGICQAQWDPPPMDPEHPAVRPWPPHVAGDA